MQENIEIPKDVSDLLDEADDGGLYSAQLVDDAIQLVTKDGKTIIREVKWEQAGAYKFKMVQAIMEHQLEMQKKA